MIFDLLLAGAFSYATLRRSSLVFYLIIGGFAGLLLLLSTSATPYHMRSTYLEGAAAATAYVDVEPPWLEPCGTPIAAAAAAAAFGKFPQRHSVHRTLKRVKTQLRVAQNHFRADLKDIHDIYSKVYKVLKEQQYRMSWLPDKQLDWYHREIWCLDKSKKAELALPRLHDALQRFAITFHHLRMFKLKSNINADITMIRRNNIVDGMKSEILRMLCEVETAILNLGLQLPKTLKSVLVTESTSWAREGDLTLMLIQDSGVLRLYQTWLNDWMRALRNATATGSGTCDPTLKSTLEKQKRRKKEKKKKKKKKKLHALKKRKFFSQSQRRALTIKNKKTNRIE